MERSKIGWTDYSGGNLNFVIGCTPVSTGCANCYARRLYERWGKDFSKVVIYPEKLEGLKTQAFPQDGNRRGPGKRPMCFVVDMGDLFHEQVPEEFLIKAFGTMLHRPDVVWQVLTKRPERMWSFVTKQFRLGGAFPGFCDGVPDHIWMGVSVEDGKSARQRIGHLLETKATISWASIEPMLTPVDLSPYLGFHQAGRAATTDGPVPIMRRGLSWVVVGAESGPNRRPFDPAWAERVFEQCKLAGVPYFYKQGSALRPGKNDMLPTYGRVHEWPEMA